MTTPNWESDLAGLLQELSSSQAELLDVLVEKRLCMAATDTHGMSQLEIREQQLCDRLQACHERRSELLQRASRQGLPSENIEQLAAAMPKGQRENLGKQVK